ncbi:MAG: hypothetical protein FWD87_10990 [Spirochaetaceae bacterium]|nr:hypothetical protein [Spirochaetaceae bacterium]
MAYEKNGIEYPSVTTILGILDKSAALKQWAANCACEHIRNNLEVIKNPQGAHDIDQLLKEAATAFNRTSEKALDIGSQVHNAIERYIKEKRDLSGELPEGVQNGFLAFLEWESKNHVVWEKSEIEIVSTKYGYAGTADAIAVINGHRYLIDFKTSKAIYDEYRMQLAAYLLGWNDEYAGDVKIDNAAVLRLDKETGEPEFRDLSKDIGDRSRAFLKLLDYYYFEKKRKLKNNPFVKAVWEGVA